MKGGERPLSKNPKESIGKESMTLIDSMGIGYDFIEKTRYSGSEQTDQMRGIPAPPLEEEFDGTIISLPDPDTGVIAPLDLSIAIESRESVRHYDEHSYLTKGELSYLLWCTQGVKWVMEDCTFRTVPSAGARHAIDTYLYVSRVQDITPGLYRFLALDHALGVIAQDTTLADLIFRASFSQECIRQAAICFIWVADAYRMTWRYGERGFRDIFLEAGHICQNLYLSVQAVGCGTCAIGAFLDEEMNYLLTIDGENKFGLYMASVGKIEQD